MSHANLTMSHNDFIYGIGPNYDTYDTILLRDIAYYGSVWLFWWLSFLALSSATTCVIVLFFFEPLAPCLQTANRFRFAKFYFDTLVVLSFSLLCKSLSVCYPLFSHTLLPLGTSPIYSCFMLVHRISLIWTPFVVNECMTVIQHLSTFSRLHRFHVVTKCTTFVMSTKWC